MVPKLGPLASKCALKSCELPQAEVFGLAETGLVGIMALMIIPTWQLVVAGLAGWINRHQQAVIAYLQEENQVYREMLGSKRPRFTDDQRRRLAAKAKVLGHKVLRTLNCIVTPDTLLRWYRQLIARKYDGSARRGPGRPRKSEEIRELIIRMAKENLSWGYTRIQGALRNLGHYVGRTTVRQVMLEHGLDPAPQRRKGLSWKEFLKIHWDPLAATDMFTVEVMTLRGLVRYTVLFVIEQATRRVKIAGVASDPDGTWVKQVMRNMLDAYDGFLTGKRYLILDRDPLYTADLRRLLKSSDVKPVRLPPRSPNLNAHAERFVRSIKSECLERMIFFSEAALVRAIHAYMEHYHVERNHQGLKNELIEPEPTASRHTSRIECRQRLGGLLKYYCRRAA